MNSDCKDLAFDFFSIFTLILLKPAESLASGSATAKTVSLELDFAETQFPGIDNDIPFSE